MSVISENRRAFFDYQILETFEAGIELKGFEVKAIKSGRINLAGAFCVPQKNEIYLMNADIPPYQANNTPENYDPLHARRLLLKKDEIKILRDAVDNKGLRLIALKVYIKNNLIKLAIGLARTKNKSDKRAAIIKKETRREMRRTAE